ncbi:MAG: DNA mismatch repair protein MutS [Bacteroidota bacterium]
MNNEIAKQYQDNIRNYQAAYNRTKVRYNWVAYLRMVVFIGGGIATYFLFSLHPYVGIGSGIAFLIAFLTLVKYHVQLSNLQRYRKRLVQINQEELQALSGDFSAFESGKVFIDPSHPYSFDLDLFGKRSLFQSLNRTVTLLGQQNLAGCLQRPLKTPKEILDRQTAIAELAQKMSWTQRFQALGFEKLEDLDDVRRLQDWLDSPNYFESHRFTPILLWVLPGVFIASLLVSIISLFPNIPITIPWHLSAIIFLFNLGVLSQYVNRTNKTQAQLGKQSRMLEKFSELFRHMEEMDFQSEQLQVLQRKLATDGVYASKAIAQLSDISGNLDQRLNLVAGILLNGMLLWDLQIVTRLERWKHTYRDHTQNWFQTLGTWDAWVSLSRLAANHPEYSWPEPFQGSANISAKGLGHPFISQDQRVDNNLELEAAGTFWLVTGANMAGKSTYLRSVGVNLILAMAGAPVCAKQLRFTPMPLVTSMRASDSLQEQTSYFYAELKRLKYIMDILREQGTAFVMVDEMLRGTNSRDKQTGSKRFIEQLIQLGGMGLIATHDLGLGELQEEYPGQVFNKRFEVDISEGALHFDYKLKEGLSQNLNATFLMEEMGIL